jgi:hypothetical protein
MNERQLFSCSRVTHSLVSLAAFQHTPLDHHNSRINILVPYTYLTSSLRVRAPARPPTSKTPGPCGAGDSRICQETLVCQPVFLRRANRPAPRSPVSNRGSPVGSGTTLGGGPVMTSLRSRSTEAPRFVSPEKAPNTKSASAFKKSATDVSSVVPTPPTILNVPLKGSETTEVPGPAPSPPTKAEEVGAISVDPKTDPNPSRILAVKDSPTASGSELSMI